MGQYAQIYVRVPVPTREDPDNKMLFAKSFSWIWGERMVSRARWISELLIAMNENTNYPENTFLEKEKQMKISRFIDINFDMHDIMFGKDLLSGFSTREEYEMDDSFADYVFRNPQNDDGKLFIDVEKDGSVKYAFTDDMAEEVMSAREYMEYECSEQWVNRLKEYEDDTLQYTKENIEYLEDNCKQLTKEELLSFIEYPYEHEEREEEMEK